ncbi:hypothetical protein [Lactococcus garvieae]|uniref:hypothetical protein n=1 Tax=Lactococcus garvieae TaxID=1363 RepID=UPI000313643D|nr:hypothetical protein [Lactococcus garvieae]
MKIKTTSGYLAETAAKFLSVKDNFYLLSTEVTPKVKYDQDNKPTDDITGYSLSVVQKGIDESFEVKFPSSPDISSLNFLAPVILTGREEVRFNVDLFGCVFLGTPAQVNIELYFLLMVV